MICDDKFFSRVTQIGSTFFAAELKPLTATWLNGTPSARIGPSFTPWTSGYAPVNSVAKFAGV